MWTVYSWSLLLIYTVKNTASNRLIKFTLLLPLDFSKYQLFIQHVLSSVYNMYFMLVFVCEITILSLHAMESVMDCHLVIWQCDCTQTICVSPKHLTFTFPSTNKDNEIGYDFYLKVKKWEEIKIIITSAQFFKWRERYRFVFKLLLCLVWGSMSAILALN